jgi:hypothetical protein
VGIVGAISFSNKPQLQSELQRYIRQGAGAPVIFTDYPDYREYSESARLGAVFNAAVRLNPNHKLVFRNTFTHDAEKSAREFSGYDGDSVHVRSGPVDGSTWSVVAAVSSVHFGDGLRPERRQLEV